MFVTVLALQALVQGLDTIGVRRIALSRHLPTGQDVNPWDRIDLDVLRPAIDDVRALAGPTVFLSAGLAVSSQDVPILCELFSAEGSVSQAWRSVAQYQLLWSDACTSSLISSEAQSMVVGLVPDGRAPSHEFTQFSFGMMLGGLIEHAGGNSLHQIWIGNDDDVLPAEASMTVDIVRVPPFYAVRIPRLALAAPIRTPRPEHALLIQRIASYLTTTEPAAAPAAVAYRYIAANLHRADFNIRTYSRSQLVSVRTAQRQLTASGTTFDDLVERVRRNEAARLLRRSTFTITDIATALGYQSTKGFARAHLRWTGLTPAAWRQQHARITDKQHVKSA